MARGVLDIDLSGLANVDSREPLTLERFWQEVFLAVTRHPSHSLAAAKEHANSAAAALDEWNTSEESPDF